MKDLVEYKKAHKCLNSDGSIKRYPKIFSIALVLTFIALVAFAAFLVSDILSLESNSYYVGSLSSLSSLNPLGNGAAMKDRQDEATDLTNGMPQHSTDKSGAAKGATVSGNVSMSSNDTGMNLSTSNLTSSQLNSKSTKINKIAKRAVVVSTSSDGDSHKISKKKNVPSKSSAQGTQGTISPLKVTVPPLNKTESLSNLPGKNNSSSNQSSNHSNLSSNITMNSSASAQEINRTEILSNMPVNNWSNSDLQDNEGFNNSSLVDNALNTSDISNELAGVDNYSIPSEPDKQVVSGGKSSAKLKDAKDKANKRISNRGKSAKSLKKPTPRARPVRTRQARPARDKSDKSKR